MSETGNKEFMLSARGAVGQTIQSNGEMSAELIYLSYKLMKPMKAHFLFVPIQRWSFSLMKILLHSLFFSFF